jgi:uncharacterized protein (DUF2336 family)
MLDFAKSMFKKRAPPFVMRQMRDTVRYEREKVIARSEDRSGRLSLAQSKKTHQEILYYMADHDPDPVIRATVARNLALPVQASMVLARDKDKDVRLALLDRLVHLLPALSKEDYSQLYAIATQALGALAMDEVLDIRMALSSALKDHAYAPPAVVARLARDVERQVAEPILRFCAVLPDDVLLDILKATPAPDSWIVHAIAGRKKVSDPVSVAVIGHGDMEGGKILIANNNAEISPQLYRDIVERARELPEWQEPLALRKGLPPEISKILSEFAQDSVRDILAKQGGFSQRMTNEIMQIFKRRLEFAKTAEADKAEKQESPYDRAVRMAKTGALSEQSISDALGVHDDDFVVAALACLAGTSLSNVKRIFALRAAKPIIALSWRAGLSMRMALQLQKEMGRVPVKELVYPRDGTDYPVPPEELRWHMDFLGLKAI